MSLTVRATAGLLSCELTLSAIQPAINRDRKMKVVRITDPYILVLEPPPTELP